MKKEGIRLKTTNEQSTTKETKTDSKKRTPNRKPKILNDDSVFYVLRKTGYTIPQARRVSIHQIQSQGALDTLIGSHNNDASHFDVIRDEDGVARTAVEISNPEADGSKSKFAKIIAVYYTTETRLKDLEILVEKMPVPASKIQIKKFDNEDDQWAEWKRALRQKFGNDSVR